MAKKELGKGLKEKLQSTVESAKNAAKDVDLSDIKAKLSETADSVKTVVKEVDTNEVKAKFSDTIDQAKSVVKDVDVQEIKSTIVEKTEGTIEAAKTQVSKTVDSVKKVNVEKKETDENDSKTFKVTSLTSHEALKIIYYVMSSDRVIDKEEEDKFNEIGNALDPNFVENRDNIVNECKDQLSKVIDDADYYDVIQDGVEEALIASMNVIGTPITPKILLWDLMTIAYSDSHFDDVEKRLLKYIVRKCDVDKSVFLEMESSLLTLMDIEKEISWIKTTDRPYLQIEAIVNELADRKNVIFESVKDLISL